MVLQLDEYEEVINSYDKKHWQALLDFIPEIEKTTNFGDTGKLEGNQFPHFDNAAIVDKFMYATSDLGLIINFDWMKWDEGRKMYEDKSFDYNSLDLPTLCKMITALVRSDRSMEGALAAAFSTGAILKILKAIEKKF